jgi:hypothetical protein
MSALDIARAYHDAWTTGSVDEPGRFLADELEVEVPINSYPTKAEFLEAVREFRPLIETIEMLAMLGDDDQALLLYDLELVAIGPLRVAEHFTVEQGLITRIRQVHDTANLRSAGFERQGR